MTENNFSLHQRLAADCAHVCELDLCKVLLMNDSRFPWLILVPRRAEIRELMDLSGEDQKLLLSELNQVGTVLQRTTDADKMNIAALGNMVPQLHWHVIARFNHDAAWPGPVWGVGQAIPYETNHRGELIQKIKGRLEA